MMTNNRFYKCGSVQQILSGITVEPVLFLYMLSTFAQYSLFQDLVYSKVCWTTFTPDICDNLNNPEFKEHLEHVQKTSSYWILMSTIALVIPSILISVYLGSWSDRFGRKWPVVIPPLGGILACVVYITLSFKPEMSVGWICLASALSGLSGGFASCIMSCMTYVAAVTSEDRRTVRISRLESMIYIGGTVGPFISGSVLQLIGHGYAFFFMMLCYGFAFGYAVFFVQDVDKDQQQRAISRSRSRPPPDVVPQEVHKSGLLGSSGNIFGVDGVLDKNDLVAPLPADDDEHDHDNSSKPTTMIPSLTGATGDKHLSSRVSFPSSTSTGNDVESSGSEEERGFLRSHGHRHFSTDYKSSFCQRYFGARHFLDAVKTVLRKREGNTRVVLILIIVAIFFAMMITAGEMDVAYLFAKDKPLQWSYQKYSYYFGYKYGLGAAVLLIGMPIFKKLQWSDVTICLLGLTSRMAGLIMYGLSVNSLMGFLVPIVAVFSFFTIPASRALLSKLVAPSEQGKMFAFVAILEDVCTLSASMLFNSVYPLTRPIMNGFIFLFAAALIVIPMGIMWFVRRSLYVITTKYQEKSNEAASTGVEDP